MPTTTLDLPIAELSPNTGQVPGLAKNPRFCKDDRFALLVKSIQDDPEMLHLREAIVYPHKGQYVIIAGNMRYRACKELKYVRMPCKVLDEATPVEKLQAYVVKDNANFGNLDLDILANEWSDLPLADWGVDLPADWLAEPEEYSDDKVYAEKELGDKLATTSKCPSCGYEW